MKKRKILIIILSLIAFVGMLFLIAFIEHLVNDPQKEIDKIINEFHNNKQDFMIVKDYVLSCEYTSSVYINKNNFSEFPFNEEEYESFSLILNNLNYIHIGFVIAHDKSSSVVEFRCSSKFMVRNIIFNGSDDDLSDSENYINLGEGWHFDSFGNV